MTATQSDAVAEPDVISPKSKTLGTIVVSSLSLAAAIFLLTPSLLFQGNADSIDIPFGNFYLISTLVVLAMSAFLTLAALLFSPYVDLWKIYLVVAIAVTIKAFLLPSQVPLLDGDGNFVRFWSAAGIWSVVSLLVAVAVALAAVYYWKLGAGLVLAVVFALSLQPLLDGRNWAFASDALGTEKMPPPENILTFSKNNENVMIVLIDSFSSDVFAEIVEENESLRDEMQGFHYFYNTVSYSPVTMMSLMTIYSGHLYEGGSSIEGFYRSAEEDSVFSDFANAGAETTLTGYRFFRLCPAQECWNERELIGTTPIESEILQYVELLEYGTLRLAPTALHDWIYNGGKGHLQRYIEPTSLGRSALSAKAISALADGLRAKDGPGTFKFFHLMTAHTPFVLDDRCRGVSPRRPTRTYYKEQATCAVQGFATLLAAMKKAGIYDNTTIVFLGDHGGHIVSGALPKRRFFEVVEPTNGRVGRYNPVLAIKPKGSREPFAVEGAPAHLVDIRKTLCAIAVECRDDVPGLNVFTIPLDSDRERKFIDFHKRKLDRIIKKTGTLPQEYIAEFSIRGDIKELDKVYDPDKRPLPH
jgi:sulfatase-like protein